VVAAVWCFGAEPSALHLLVLLLQVDCWFPAGMQACLGFCQVFAEGATWLQDQLPLSASAAASTPFP